jgi:MoaA/NifB/PqqE/SkfB family radical SAM enzyme
LNSAILQKKTAVVAGKVSESNLQLSDIHTLQIEPTTYCNARCPHCPRFDSTGQVHPALALGHLDIKAMITNLELEKMTGLHTVVLEGDKGDPLMHPRIEDLVHLFSSAPSQPEIRLFTNGSIRSADWWHDLAQKKYPNLRVIFSIDGLEDTNHLYRVGLDYDTIMQNVRAFIAGGGHACWKFILFKHNQHQFDSISEISKTLGFAEFIYTTCRQGDFQGLSKWPVQHDGTVTHYLEPPTSSKHGILKHKHTGTKNHATATHPERLCPNLSNGQIYINYLAQVVPCCMMHFDTQLDYPGRDRLQEMTGGFDNQDLTKHSMSQILGKQFFAHTLRDSLGKGQWHFNCVRSCKSQITENLKHAESSI